MRKIIFSLVASLALLTSSVAMADGPACTNPITVTPCTLDGSNHPFRFGFGMDLGLPSGVALGFVLNPKLDWLRLQASLTYDYLSFGGRGSVQLDPLALLPNLPIGLFADIQGGFQPMATIPGHSDL